MGSWNRRGRDDTSEVWVRIVGMLVVFLVETERPVSTVATR